MKAEFSVRLFDSNANDGSLFSPSIRRGEFGATVALAVLTLTCEIPKQRRQKAKPTPKRNNCGFLASSVPPRNLNCD